MFVYEFLLPAEPTKKAQLSKIPRNFEVLGFKDPTFPGDSTHVHAMAPSAECEELWEYVVLRDEDEIPEGFKFAGSVINPGPWHKGSLFYFWRRTALNTCSGDIPST